MIPIRWEWKDGSGLQRGSKDGDIAIPGFPVLGRLADKPCGRVDITARIEKGEPVIRFVFTPSEPLPDGCCRAYGWIQHECSRGGWRFDNGSESGRWGAPSDPGLDPQGSNEGERWDPNPWYGGTGNVKEERARRIREEVPEAEQADALDRLNQDFERKPEPQTTIQDRPGGPSGFITQLVCVESGKVAFQYRWLVYRERGEVPLRFVGAAGDNLTIIP